MDTVSKKVSNSVNINYNRPPSAHQSSHWRADSSPTLYADWEGCKMLVICVNIYCTTPCSQLSENICLFRRIILLTWIPWYLRRNMSLSSIFSRGRQHTSLCFYPCISNSIIIAIMISISYSSSFSPPVFW